MPPGLPQRLFRTAALLLLAGFGLLIVSASLVKQRWPADMDFLLVRWPVWLLIGVGVPLLVLRLLTWHKRRSKRQAPTPPPA